MRDLKRISVLWLSTCQERPVGLVKAFDPVTGNRPAAGRWTYYAGIGHGWDEAADVREILAWGQKYEDLSVLQAFLAETEPPGCSCPHCGMRLGPLRAGDGKEECP